MGEIAFAKGAYFRRISQDMVELHFPEQVAKVLMIRREPYIVWLDINNRPCATFYTEDAELIEYWTDLERLKEDFASSDARAVFRLLLVDLTRPLRPYRSYKEVEK